VPSGAYTDNGSAAVATGPHAYAFWIGTPAPDARVGITFTTPANTWAGVTARGQSGNPAATNYTAYIDPNSRVGLAIRNNFTYSYVASGPTVSPGSHRLEIQTTGTSPLNVTVWLDGVQVISYSDPNPLPPGAAGFMDYNGIGLPEDDFDVSAGSSGVAAGHQPVAVITGGPFSGTAPDTVFLDGTTSYTQVAGGWITDYFFDFGDGTSASQGWGNHTSAVPGSYTVTLTVTDDLGTNANTTQVVSISAP
jgi:hypothetical protein